MNKAIGFIGGGNMASAIIGGILHAGITDPSCIMVSGPTEEKLRKLEKKFHVRITTDNKEAAAISDILFLSTKPAVYPTMIKEVKDSLKTDAAIVSIAAGQSIRQVESLFGNEIQLARVMPNTPALVGSGMAAVSANKSLNAENLQDIMTIFRIMGKAEVVPESMMDAVTGVSGSSPAFVYLFIEAMADAAVAEGMPRDLAYEFSAQSVLGSAKMVLETKQNPGALKDTVCSPGGTTIEGVCELERKGMRDAVISAVRASTAKSREMDLH